MTNVSSNFEKSFSAAFNSHNNQFHPTTLEAGSPEHAALTFQANQLEAAYDIMAEQGLQPHMVINHTEPAPARRSRGVGPCHDPLVTGPERYNQPYVTLFGAPMDFWHHQDDTAVLRQAIIDTTDLELIPEATLDNFIASSAEILSIVTRPPVPTKQVAFVGRDSREVRSGVFGQHQETYHASLDYYPPVPASESSKRKRARKVMNYAEVYTSHTVIPAFGILHLVGSLKP